MQSGGVGRENAHGADLNRNFPDQFRDGSSQQELLKGREPETLAAMTWIDSRIDFSNLKPIEKNYFNCDIVWLPRIRAITGYGDGSVLDINKYERFCYVYADNQEES